MEKWRDELYHHGIKGMKWGVRRFQNPDGTLTEAGRKRYSSGSSFSKAEDNVRKKLSNSPKEFRTMPMSLDTVKQRGKLTNKEALECSKLAEKVFEKAKSVEPEITNDIVTIANKNGIDLYGLNFRLKQPTSIAAKIGSDAKSDDISFKEAANGIKDSIRYTTVSKDNDFVKNYKTMKKSLEKNGYSEVVCKNYFDMYNRGLVKHKSVQSTFQNKDGYKFEMQFQTTSSQAAKELKIPIYERRRQSGLSDAEKRSLETQMEELAMRVSEPYDINKIKSHK